MLEKLKKLKGRSGDELLVRGGFAVNALLERLNVSAQSKLPSSSQLFAGSRSIDDEDDSALFEFYRNHAAHRFHPSFLDMNATVEAFRVRFPDEVKLLTNQADRICEGLFDFLGYENLYFAGTLPDWHLDPLNGEAAPKVHWSKIDIDSLARKADLKIIWELNRHQFFTTLGRAYLLTNNEKYAVCFVNNLKSWFKSNSPKIGINWASSLEIAYRAISWIWAFNLFRDAAAFTPEIAASLLRHLYLHGRHLETYLSTYSSPNTHLTGEALGLYHLGTFFSEIKAGARWKSLGYEIMMQALDFQVRPDGTYCEQSSHYHRYTIDIYVDLLISRRHEGEKIEEKHLQKLNELFNFLLYITQPDGEMPLFGDDDGGRLSFLDSRPVTDVRGTLALGAVTLNRGDLKLFGDDAAAEILWLLGAEGLKTLDKLRAELPAQVSKPFTDGGFFVMRDSWKRRGTFILIDCGSHGFLSGGHAHADALGFVMSMAGEPVFVDSGTYKYASEPAERNYFRSSQAHNCLTVNDESSSLSRGPWDWTSVAECRLLEWREDQASVFFRGTHDGFKRFGVEYEREILLRRKESVSVTDRVNSAGVNRYQIHFILSQNMRARIGADFISIAGGEYGSQITIKLITKIDGEKHVGGLWKLEKCYISPRYGSKIETTKLIFSFEGSGKLSVCNSFSATISESAAEALNANDPMSEAQALLER